jgi:non-lysosomal glucosylceramidase
MQYVYRTLMKNDDPKQRDPCDDNSCDCQRTWARRDFLSLTAVATAGALIGDRGLPVMAGPFADENEYLKTIPTDKKLDPAWIASLSTRGEKETYSDPAALRHIGMPIGGLFAGTVYLSGDGRLWLWDIFNKDQTGILPRSVPLKAAFHGSPISGGLNYVHPAPLTLPFELVFAIRHDGKRRTLDSAGFSSVTFDGRYPLGRVAYREESLPLDVTLEAFSPFIPLNVADSSLPATVMQYTVENRGNAAIEVELLGHIQNAVCHATRDRVTGRLINRVVRTDQLTAVECSAEPRRRRQGKQRPEILFENFEKPTYANWQVEGTAFGTGPVEIKEIPDYQGDVGGQGAQVANSHASAPGADVGQKDAAIGTLTSRPFTIERRYIRFLVGGGAHQGQTCINVRIGGKVVATQTGRNANQMRPAALDVRQYEGKQAQIEIVDRARTGWGNIGVDEIVFTDQPLPEGKLTEQRDFGSMTLTLLGTSDVDFASADRRTATATDRATSDLDDELVGQVGRKVQLAPGESVTISYVVTWHFPNLYGRGLGNRRVGHSYAARFDSAIEVARYVAANFDRLAETTRRWVDTWYDSTLPFWFLDRTMANTSTLATTTCYRLADGRFWAWEGIGCCQGTCTHVWHYAQALGRLFPEIERGQREQVDFGMALHEDGGIGMRAGLTSANEPADDGQCGRILGAYREHEMTANDEFLQRTWPGIKRAIEYLIRKDANADGMIEGAQPNTLDAAWFGKISFLASLYVATLRAGAAMANEMGDRKFATTCQQIAARGARSILATYNGEFFTQIEDETHKNAIGIGPGCYIDQIFGQTWAHWVGLDRLFDRDKQLSALRALWKYNFVPDVGPFREKFPRGRWYALAGDAGLLMCTWPKGGQNPDFKKHWQYMYFNECMSGFEWQAAAGMIAEGIDQPDLLQNGLAIARAIHDRYNARLRNPYNEIECSDHYARAMASYGAYQAACGYTYHGPKGRLGFAPRLAPENFKAAFTAAEGWGSYQQRIDKETKTLHATIELRWGQLRLRALDLPQPFDTPPSTVTASVDGTRVDADVRHDRGQNTMTFAAEVLIAEGHSLSLTIQ